MATTSDINAFHSQLPEAYLFHFLCVHYPSASQLLNSIERVTACLGMPCTHQHRLRFLVILLRMAKINCGIADPAFFRPLKPGSSFQPGDYSPEYKRYSLSGDMLAVFCKTNPGTSLGDTVENWWK